jgi:hypothetical protein
LVRQVNSLIVYARTKRSFATEHPIHGETKFDSQERVIAGLVVFLLDPLSEFFSRTTFAFE